MVNYSTEISKHIGTSQFKTLASGEPIEARSLYNDPIIIENYAKLIFNVNELPSDVELNEAFFRRFLIIPFEKTIPRNERDIHLAGKIVKNELPGILNWCLEGLDRLLQQNKFTYSEKIELILEDYRKESDSVALFLEENNYSMSHKDYITQQNLLSEYKKFAKKNNFPPISSTELGKRLDKLGFVRKKKEEGKVVYIQKQ